MMDGSRIPSFSVDIKNLIQAFLQKRSLSFVVFKETWKDLGFSLIHESKWEAFSAAEYTQLLYSTTLGYFHVNASFPVRAAVIYTLYLLYETQHAATKEKIIVSLAVWEEICKFVSLARAARLVDLYQILVKMKQDGFWIFAALPPSNIEAINLAISVGGAEPSAFFPDAMLNVDTINGVIDLAMLQKSAEEYQQAKDVLVTGGFSSDLSQSSLTVSNSRLGNEVQDLLVHHNEEKSQIFRSFGLPVPDVQSLGKASEQRFDKKTLSQKAGKQTKVPPAKSVTPKKTTEEPDLFASTTFTKTPAAFSGLNLPFADIQSQSQSQSQIEEIEGSQEPEAKRSKVD